MLSANALQYGRYQSSELSCAEIAAAPQGVESRLGFGGRRSSAKQIGQCGRRSSVNNRLMRPTSGKGAVFSARARESGRGRSRDNARAAREARPRWQAARIAARRDREETRVLLTDVSVEGRRIREEAHRRGSLARHPSEVRPYCRRRTRTSARRRVIALRIQLIFTHKHVRPSD